MLLQLPMPRQLAAKSPHLKDQPIRDPAPWLDTFRRDVARHGAVVALPPPLEDAINQAARPSAPGQPGRGGGQGLNLDAGGLQ